MNGRARPKAALLAGVAGRRLRGTVGALRMCLVCEVQCEWAHALQCSWGGQEKRANTGERSSHTEMPSPLRFAWKNSPTALCRTCTTRPLPARRTSFRSCWRLGAINQSLTSSASDTALVDEVCRAQRGRKRRGFHHCMRSPDRLPSLRFGPTRVSERVDCRSSHGLPLAPAVLRLLWQPQAAQILKFRLLYD